MRLLHDRLMGAARLSVLAVLAVLAFSIPNRAVAQPEDAEQQDLAAAQELAAEPEAGADMAEAPVQPAAAAALVGYKKGFFIKGEDERFALKLQARVQSRYTFESVEDPATGDRATETSFAVQRARLALSGHAFDEDLTFKFQSDFGKGSVSLKDFYIDYKIGSEARIRTGQWKKPFSRQQITSSGRQALVDRSITDKFFRAGRDIGVGVHNNYDKSPEIEWAAGVFNGTGEGTVPDKLSPVIVARVGYNQGGIKGYSEADLEGGPLRYGIGASVQSELDFDEDNDSGVRAELDYVVKVNGLSSNGGVYVSTAQEVPGAEDTGFANQAYEATGFHLQLGYMLAEHHQLAGRYALIAPDGGGNLQEITVGYSLYQFAHNFKWQTDASVLQVAGADLGGEIRVRTQLQLSF